MDKRTEDSHIFEPKDDESKSDSDMPNFSLINNQIQTNPQKHLDNYLEKSVMFYCPFNNTYTVLNNYKKDEILSFTHQYGKDHFFIVQISNDEELQDEIVLTQFKLELRNTTKVYNLNTDFCFSPLKNLLCFNLSVLTNINFDQIDKFVIQIFCSRFGLYIFNKDGCDTIKGLFVNNYNFIQLEKDEFFHQAMQISSRDTSTVNNLNFKMLKRNFSPEPRRSKSRKGQKTKILRSNTYVNQPNRKEEIKIKDEIEAKKTTHHESIFSIKEIAEEVYEMNEAGKAISLMTPVAEHEYETKNFSTDDLIYLLLKHSLEKLEEFSDSLNEEAESLNKTYTELTAKQKKDFFRNVHVLKVSMQLIFQETQIKKKFLKYSKKHLKVYNQLSNNFYFQNTFDFLIELMMNKVSQLEYDFERLEQNVNMINDKYSVHVEELTGKQDLRLHNLLKVLAMMTTFYAPFNIITAIWGMNIHVPGGKDDSLWPFWCIILFLMVMIWVMLFLFRKLKWLIF